MATQVPHGRRVVIASRDKHFPNCPDAKLWPKEGASLQRTIDPPPPPPILEVIVVYGPQGGSHWSLVDGLAKNLGMKCFNLAKCLFELNDVPNTHPKKKLLLAPMHPYALASYINTGRYPPLTCLLDICRNLLDELVEIGERRFVVAGLPPLNPMLLATFQAKIAVPNAIIILHCEGCPEWYENVRKAYEAKRDRNILVVPFRKDDLGVSYRNVLAALYDRAHQAIKRKSLNQQPKGAPLRVSTKIKTGGDRIDSAVDLDDNVPCEADEEMLDTGE